MSGSSGSSGSSSSSQEPRGRKRQRTRTKQQGEGDGRAVTPLTAGALELHPLRPEPMASAFQNAIPLAYMPIPDWIKEDMPGFDFGGFVVGEAQRDATIWQKSPGMLAGVPFASEVFRQLGCEVTWLHKEGTWPRDKESGTEKVAVAEVSGPARNLLAAERVALNILARASGIATRTDELVQLVRDEGWQGVVAGTRKTTPGFRMVEKYAMMVGGADPHRMDLSSMVMLKDNHIWSTGSIANAVREAKRVAGFSMKVEVEVRTMNEAVEAVTAGADVIMLDNFAPGKVGRAATELKELLRDLNNGFLIEVSGGLNIENALEYIHHDIDILSTSWIHQGVPHVDFSMKIARLQGDEDEDDEDESVKHE